MKLELFTPRSQTIQDSSVVSWPLRLVSVGLAAVQLFTCQAWLITVAAISITPGPVALAATDPTVSITAAESITIAPSAASLEASASSKLFAQSMQINREVPVDLPIIARYTFTNSPTADEIFAKAGLMEPMVWVGTSNPTADENRVLAVALEAYRKTKSDNPEDVSALTSFLNAHSTSGWRAALLVNLGLIYRQTGYFSRALDAWEEVVRLVAGTKQVQATQLVDRALSELAELNSRLGRQDRLKELLAQSNGRQLFGAASTRVEGARMGLSMMENQPGTSFKCGPYALGRILASQGTFTGERANAVHEVQSTSSGTSLAQVAQFSKSMGMDYRMAKRQPGSAVIVPAVVHWKAGHFAALIRQLANGKYWLEDPTFGGGIQISQAALDEEASGYFVIPGEQTLPTGWQNVANNEGQTVWGKGAVSGHDPDSTDPCQHQSGGNGAGAGGGATADSENANQGGSCATCSNEPRLSSRLNNGMPGYTVQTMQVSAHITDTPVGYAPPLGPSVFNTVTYNQYEANQLSGYAYSNFGPLWNFNWLTYIVIDSAKNALVHTAGGGTTSFSFSTFDDATQTYGVNSKGQSYLVKVSATNYVQHFPDDSTMIYSVPDAAGNLFLKQMVDPWNNAVTLHYEVESNPINSALKFRINSISDALGQVTTFSYDLAADAYKITKISDPFGRYATFGYVALGGTFQLVSITDVVGMTSQFSYQGNSVHLMMTPYGQTTFTSSILATNSSVRVLEVTDPNGAKERWESWLSSSPISDSEPVAPNMAVANRYLTNRNTFYWSKKSLVDDPSHPYSKSTIYHWLHTQGGLASGTLESVKKPLENRVWYTYPGQSSVIYEGASSRPTNVGRVLDDGSTTQLSKYQYNADNTQMISKTDPVGRTTFYDYALNKIDLVNTRQDAGNTKSFIVEQRVYDAKYPHRPKQIIDASGQSTYFTYDAQGRTLTVTNAKGNVITCSYVRDTQYPNDGPADGYLYSVSNKDSTTGLTSKMSYMYDVAGRRTADIDLSYTSDNSRTNAYVTTYDQDGLNRKIKTSYPDGSCVQLIYSNLDVEWQKNREGQWTHYLHDNLRHITSITDPLGRVTTYGYCLCGGLASITDAAGHTTQLISDIQGRVTNKILPDNTQMPRVYEQTTSRLKQTTDGIGEVINYSYYLDDKVHGVSYANVAHYTSSVDFTYDTVFGDVATMSDDSGVTTYKNGPLTLQSVWPLASPVTGAGRLTSESKVAANNSTFSSYTLSHTYDAVGLRTNRSIDGTSNSETYTYDGINRVTAVTNGLGNFGYQYNNASPQLTLEYLGGVSGLRTAYAYYGNSGDRRLQTISNFSSTGSIISKFDYTYNKSGDILTWSQQFDSNAASVYNMEYDAADQLRVAALTNAPNGTQTYSYGYDAISNRVDAQLGSAVTTASPNTLAQISQISAGGSMRFSGKLSEPASVTVGGHLAQLTGNNFSGYANVNPGTNTVPITATKSNGLATTNNYQVSADPLNTRTLVYDLNGNLVNDGTGNTFEWDAANRLAAINYVNTTNRSEFFYDGLGRRIQETERSGSKVTVQNFIWDGKSAQPSEVRTGSNLIVNKIYLQGEVINNIKYYHTYDHLHSLRELTKEDGQVITRYSYDPFGQRTKTFGATDSIDSVFGYTRMMFHPASGLSLARYRAYDSTQGRWLSRDPVIDKQLPEGTSAYAYVSGNPVKLYDPYGLSQADCDAAYSRCLDAALSSEANILMKLSEAYVALMEYIKGQHDLADKLCHNDDWNIIYIGLCIAAADTAYIAAATAATDNYLTLCAAECALTAGIIAGCSLTYASCSQVNKCPGGGRPNPFD